MEFYKVNVVPTSKQKVKDLISELKLLKVEEIGLLPIHKDQIDSFIKGDRDNLMEVLIDGELTFQVVGDKKSAEAIKMMLGNYGVSELQMAPISLQNLMDFVAGKRKDVLTLEVANVPKGEELPGHVG